MEDRRVSFHGIPNCRDLGGLENRRGRKIRRGLLYRSAHLAAARPEDLEKLSSACGVRLIVDLRTPDEIALLPDRLPQGVRQICVPILSQLTDGITHEREEAQLVPPLEALYRVMARSDACRRRFGEALCAIMTHDFSDGAALWHCTEGKDRCGLVTAMLLCVLDVDEARIREDYLMTNEINVPKAEEIYRRMREAGYSEAVAQSVRDGYVARDSYLDAFLDEARASFGGLAPFVSSGLGISQRTIDLFTEKVLEA